MKATEGNEMVTICHHLAEARYNEAIIAEICDLLKTDRSNIVQKVEALIKENGQMYIEIQKIQRKNVLIN